MSVSALCDLLGLLPSVHKYGIPCGILSSFILFMCPTVSSFIFLIGFSNSANLIYFLCDHSLQGHSDFP